MKWFVRLAALANLRVSKYGAQYLTFALYVMINYPIAYFYGIYGEQDSSYDYFILRILSLLLCVPLLLNKKWPHNLKPYLPIYWYLTLIVAIPVMSLYMLIEQKFSLGWVVNFNIGVMIMILLVDWVVFIILELVGIAIAVLLYAASHDTFPSIPDNDTVSLFFYMYFWVTVTGVVFSRNKEVFNQLLLQVQKKLNIDLEEIVSERTVELTKALAVKHEFLNNISHEIRAPIMAFSTAASTLTEHWDELSEKDKYKMADNVAKSAERIKNLSMHLIAATKLQEGARILNFQEVSLSKLIKNFNDEALGLYTKEKNIKIKFDAPCDYIIKADPESFTQVLRNLVTNAIKYSPPKSTITIGVLELANGQVEIRIIDEGVGIPDGEFEAIFEPFSQSSRTKTGAGGVGLGLNIAKQIVEVHGGRIWAANNKKKGASFCFTLGFIASTVDLSRARGKTIIIIDDEELLLDSMKLKLISLGSKVLVAAGGELGLELIAKRHKSIDAVVLDIMMPGISGIETLKRIKAQYPSLKVIMHSGIATDAEIDEATGLGADHFLAKPYPIDELIGLL